MKWFCLGVWLLLFDCVELVEAYNGRTDIWSPNAAILADCFHLTHGVPMFSFKHCTREANVWTHYLARFCYDSKTSYDWVDDTHMFLLTHILLNVTVTV